MPRLADRACDDSAPERKTAVAGPDAGQTVYGGYWNALDPATGKILWQTLDPADPATQPSGVFAGGVDMGLMTVANGVV